MRAGGRGQRHSAPGDGMQRVDLLRPIKGSARAINADNLFGSWTLLACLATGSLFYYLLEINTRTTCPTVN
jgi:hypothetical protein